MEDSGLMWTIGGGIGRSRRVSWYRVALTPKLGVGRIMGAWDGPLRTTADRVSDFSGLWASVHQAYR